MGIEIPSELRARLRHLRLQAPRAQGAQGVGLHASRSRGAGLEFAQYRSYERGDDPRLIDWKLYARSDRHAVREAHRESPLTVWVVIDCSASMAQADTADPARTKLDAAQLFAACTIELALQQGDSFGVVSLGGDSAERPTVHVDRAATGGRHRDRCLLALAALRCAGSFPAEDALVPLWHRLLPGTLVVVLSDGFDDACTALAERLSSTGRDVAHIQLLSADECSLPFHGGHLFREPETGAALQIDADQARTDYLRRFGAARAELARRLAASGVAGVAHVLGEPVDRPLAQLFGAGLQRAPFGRVGSVIGLLSPLALVALAAWVLPLLVHLWRRPQGPDISFAALRWLRPHSLPRARRAWHERILLLLRLLLLAAIALLLAAPVWRSAGPAGPPWVLVHPGVTLAAAHNAVHVPGAQWHWLAPGMPQTDTLPGPPPPPTALHSLLRELDVTLPPAVPWTVVVPTQLTGLDAERLRLQRAVDWRVLPGHPVAPAVAPPLELHVALQGSADAGGEAAVARALVTAWQALGPSRGVRVVADTGTETASSSRPTWARFRLSVRGDAGLADALARGETVLASGRTCPDGEPALRDLAGTPQWTISTRGRGRLLCLATALTPDRTPSLRDPELPRRLFDVLLAGTALPAPDIADADAVSPLPDTEHAPRLWTQPLSPWLQVTVALLFCAERLWATRRRVGAPA